jgi:hypothetical protein
MNMIQSLLLAFTFVLAASAAPAGDTKTTAQTPARTPAKLPAGLPAGAEPVNAQQWRHTDAEGQKWIYTRTPFGWSRGHEDKVTKAESAEPVEAKPGSPRSSGPALEIVEVRANEVVFQRATPFGRSRWTKAKSALDDAEKAALAARK